MTKKVGKKRRFSLPPRFDNLDENRDVSFKVDHLSTESRSKILGRRESGYGKDAHKKVVRKKAKNSQHSTLRQSLQFATAGAVACASAFAAFHIFHSSFLMKSQHDLESPSNLSLETAASQDLNQEIERHSKLRFRTFARSDLSANQTIESESLPKIVVRKLNSQEGRAGRFISKNKEFTRRAALQKDQKAPISSKSSNQVKKFISTESVNLAPSQEIEKSTFSTVKGTQADSIQIVDTIGNPSLEAASASLPNTETSFPKVSTQPENSLTDESPDVEGKRMRNLYRMMRHRFYLAVNTQIEDRIKIAKQAPIHAPKTKKPVARVKKLTTHKKRPLKPEVSTQVVDSKKNEQEVIQDEFQINWTKPRDQKIVVTKLDSGSDKNPIISKPSDHLSIHSSAPSGQLKAAAAQMWQSMSTQNTDSNTEIKVDRAQNRIEIVATHSVEVSRPTEGSTNKIEVKLIPSTDEVESNYDVNTQFDHRAISSRFIEGSISKSPEYSKVSTQDFLANSVENKNDSQVESTVSLGPNNKNEYPYIEYSNSQQLDSEQNAIEITRLDDAAEKVEGSDKTANEVASDHIEEALLPVDQLPLPDVPTTNIVEVSESDATEVASLGDNQSDPNETPDLQSWFQPGYRYAEAFKSAETLAQVSHKKISSERFPVTNSSTGVVDLTSKSGAWVQSSANDHIPTLAWHPETAARTEVTIPLISTGSTSFLQLRMRAKIQPEAGIVYGHLPKGWSFDTSFVPQNMLLFDVDGKKLENDEPRARYDARTFVIANVAPGAHVIFLSEMRNGDPLNVVRDGAVGFPVLKGKVTYLDLRDVRKNVSATGTIYASNSKSLAGLKNVHVKTLAQRDRGVFTDENGKYRFTNVTLFGDYPIIVEAQSYGGFKHRYQLNPGQFQNAQLFHFDDEQIQELVQQLGGDELDPESGIVISAIPGVSEKLNYEPVFPSVETLVDEPSFVPETYTLSPKGQLMVETALPEQSPRFVSVQVPEGPAVAKILDRSGQPTASWMVYSSPGVINVLMPDSAFNAANAD